MLDEILQRFSHDCRWREESHAKKTLKAQACGVYFPDLEQPRPPDLPPGMMNRRVVQDGKGI